MLNLDEPAKDHWLNESMRSFSSLRSLHQFLHVCRGYYVRGKKGYVHCVISYPYRGITPVPCCVSAPENHRSEYLLRFIRHKITRHESFGFKGCLPDCIFFPSRRDRTSSLLMSVNSIVSDIVLTIHGVSFW